MKKRSLFIFTLIILATNAMAQGTKPSQEQKLYNPSDDAQAEIDNAVKKAGGEGKHVLLQIGGNWCSWCIAFDKKVKSTDTLSLVMDKNYVIYHVNYSPENRNKEVLKSLDYPQRFGFPVFVVLDGAGSRLHTQNSAYLEEGKGHSTKKVLEFFQHWSPAAIDPKEYED
jgi:thioredoxin-related protein